MVERPGGFVKNIGKIGHFVTDAAAQAFSLKNKNFYNNDQTLLNKNSNQKQRSLSNVLQSLVDFQSQSGLKNIDMFPKS